MYTNADIEASTKFAEYNVKARTLQLMHKNAPHLVSHLKISIRDATNDDFYVPRNLKHAAKIMTVDLSEKLCSMLSCNPVKEDAPCTPNTGASYYHVGDDSYDIQCQPSCFNTAKKITYNEDGSRAADVPMLNWHNGDCRIVNAHIVSWLEKTFYRSDTKYETRVNDMPTGFSRTSSDNQNGCGFTYRSNAAYCNYFDRSIADDGSCTTSVWETILDATIGMSVINNLRSSIRMLVNGKVPFSLPENLPKLPTTIPAEYTLKGWQDTIDKSFELPPVIDTSPKAPTRTRRDVSDGGDNDARDHIDPEDMSDFMRLRMGLPKRSTVSTTIVNRDSADWLERAKDMLISLLEMITQKDFWINAGIDIIATTILDKLKATVVKVAAKLTAFLAKGGLKLGGSIGIKVLSSGIRGILVHTVANTVVRTAARAALMLSKILIAASSIIGWILLVTMFLDLLFQFWDPYGYNNLFPAELPNDMMQSGELALRQALASATANYTFDNLTGTLLSEDELLGVQIESLIDRLTYLDSLVVNSEGSRIDKGDEINADATLTENNVTAAGNQVLAQRVRFDPITFAQYNERFNDRVALSRYINYTGAASVAVAIVSTVLSGFSLFTIIAFVVALIVLCLAMVNLYDDSLLDLYTVYARSNPV